MTYETCKYRFRPASVKRNRTYGVSHTPLTLRLVICIVGEWGRGWEVSLGSNDNNSLRDDRRDRLLRWQVYNGCNLLQRRERRPHARERVCVYITVFRKTIYRMKLTRLCVCVSCEIGMRG